jgi:putative transposase
MKTTAYSELSDSQWQVIASFLNIQRKRSVNLRDIINAIHYMTCNNLPWRLLPADFGKKSVVYYYFAKFRDDGTLEKIRESLVQIAREKNGREKHPSALAVDSQSVKSVQFVSQDIGVDGGKRVKGRKRHIAVDALGLPVALHVSAANVSDNDGGIILLKKLEGVCDRLQLFRVDAGYKKEFVTAANSMSCEVEYGQRPESEKGFVPQKGRWQVERTFGWLNFRRRLDKDREKLAKSHEAFLNIAFIFFIINML